MNERWKLTVEFDTYPEATEFHKFMHDAWEGDGEEGIRLEDTTVTLYSDIMDAMWAAVRRIVFYTIPKRMELTRQEAR